MTFHTNHHNDIFPLKLSHQTENENRLQQHDKEHLQKLKTLSVYSTTLNQAYSHALHRLDRTNKFRHSAVNVITRFDGETTRRKTAITINLDKVYRTCVQHFNIKQCFNFFSTVVFKSVLCILQKETLP